MYLGCSDEEKFHPQMVSINIDLHFTRCLDGADTDRIEDVVCYLNLVKALTAYCESKRFNLIENLAKSICVKIANLISQNSHLVKSIVIELHKISPPVPGVHGGVKWTHHLNYGGSL